MPNTYQLGRLGKLFAAAEATYGIAASLVATDAVRHLIALLNSNPRNRVDSPERHAHPSQLTRFTRKETAHWQAGGIFYPSGVINTLPDHTDFIEHGLGTKTNVTLATTLSVGATVSGGTVASAGTLAVGDAVLIACTGGSTPGNYVRWLTSVAANVLGWAPALPQAPATGDALKGCITYKLATNISKSLTIAKYLQNISREVRGAVIEQIKFTLDANDEVRWEASGVAATRQTAQAQPGAFTVVGNTPPSGISGGMRIGASAFEFVKAEFTIQNGLDVDNVPFGISRAQAFYRKGDRKVSADINAMMSSDVTLLTAAEGTTDQVVLAQCGSVEGSIIAMYAPVVEFDVPDDQDADETMDQSFKGACKGVAGNDEFSLAVA